MTNIEIKVNGEKYGPYDRDSIDEYVASGRISRATPARLVGSDQWGVLSDILGDQLQVKTPSLLPNNSVNSFERPSDKKTTLQISYALYGVGILTAGIISFAGLIFCYVLKSKHNYDAIIVAHCVWLINTFWIAFGAGMLFWLLLFFGAWIVSVIGLLGTSIWYIYRLISGFISLQANCAPGR